MDPLAAAQARADLRRALAAPAVAPSPLYEFHRTAPPPPSDRLQQRLAELDTEEGQHAQYAEVQRICNLPIRYPMTPEEVDAYTRMNVLAAAYDAGFRLFPPQAEAVMAYEQFAGVLATIGVGFGKCGTGDTEVWDIRRGRRRIDEEGPLHTPSMHEPTGQIIEAEATAFPSGVKECVRLFLKSGQHVGLSLDHPVFTQRGWVQAGDIQLTDLVACPRQFPSPSSHLRLEDAEVRVLANLLANGACTQNQCTLSDESGPLLDEFQQDIRALGASSTVEQSRSKAMLVRTQGMLPFVRRWGVDSLSKHKRLPAVLYSMSPEQVALFLNRFWAADGHVNVSQRLLECTLASEGLIRDLQFLLLRLGILSRYGPKKASYRDTEGQRVFFDAWRLSITGKPMVGSLFSSIGLILGHEKACLSLLGDLGRIKTNTNTDIVPIGRAEFSEICDELGLPERGSAKKGQGRPRTDLRKRLGVTDGQFLGRDAFAEWVRESGYIGKYAWLARSDLVWERVKGIQRIGPQPVYDLSVPTTHSFVGNGIVLHNTLCTLMIAHKATKKGIKKILLSVPAQVFAQLTTIDIKWARARVPISYPIHLLGGKGMQARLALAKSNKHGLYIMPSSLFSAKDAEEVLFQIYPELVIVDECHEYANDSTARTQRLRRFCNETRPEMCGFSGTITHKSIKEYHHLARWCLKNNCPLPHAVSLMNDWAAVLDAAAGRDDDGANRADTSGALLPLVRWAKRHFPEQQIGENLAGFRAAYRLRLNSAPGVVTSGDSDIGTSLLIANVRCEPKDTHPGKQELDRLVAKVELEWLTPNDDEIEYAIHKWKWLNELTAGFYNLLTWPAPETLAQRRQISTDAAGVIIERAKEHHIAGQDYARMLRSFIQDRGRKGLDTPLLIGQSMARLGNQEVGQELYGLWCEWKRLDFEGRPDRDSSAVRVCDYKVAMVVEWAKHLPANRGALIWVWHQEIGRWVFERLTEAGIDSMHAPAGNQYNAAILDHRNSGKKVVASISSHGTGKNLQHFQEQLFVQFPRPADDAEQTIGRTHRSGQMADNLIVYTLHSNEFDDLNFAACLNDALYTQQTTGSRQKILYASYDPQPKIFPPNVLHERGLDNRMLTAEQQALLHERFG